MGVRFVFGVLGLAGCIEATPGGTGDSADTGATPPPEGCAFGEPNDTVDDATPIASGVTYRDLCVTGTDGDDPHDVFAFTAPATDAAGGWIRVSMSNVRDGGLSEFILSGADGRGFVDQYAVDPDTALDGWATVAPGVVYTIDVMRFAGTGPEYRYDLTVTYTPIDDAFEPNQTPDDAPPIDVGTPIHASAAAVSANAELAPEDDADWYTVTLHGGSATVALTDAPSDFACDVMLVGPTGDGAGESYSLDGGADCTVVAEDLDPGDYTIGVIHFAGGAVRGGGGSPPAYVGGSYTLEVTE
ncbi:MAG: hypothetical protein ABMB14_09780 [Myxococcota bacterium]